MRCENRPYFVVLHQLMADERSTCRCHKKKNNKRNMRPMLLCNCIPRLLFFAHRQFTIAFRRFQFYFGFVFGNFVVASRIVKLFFFFVTPTPKSFFEKRIELKNAVPATINLTELLCGKRTSASKTIMGTAKAFTRSSNDGKKA